MKDIVETLNLWREAGERIALATVIKVEGSAPRSEGAKMAITESGKIAGSVSGGCVESAVAQEAATVLKTGAPTIVRYGIDRNMMWDIGLSCGGAIEVFIEPLAEPMPRKLERAFAVGTIVRGPNRIGKKIILWPDGSREGGLGDEQVDGSAARAAAALIDGGQSKVVPVDQYEIFIDVSAPDPQLIMVGAVHIAVALCQMAVLAGFSVVVIDPRPALNNSERFPLAAQRIVAWPEDALPHLTFDENTYVAVLTHDEKFDDPTLLHVLRTSARYVGAIGSRKTQALRRKRLLDGGVSETAVAKLRGPIGLDIGAQSPEEIAVAILSEMIAAKYQRAGSPMRDKNSLF